MKKLIWLRQLLPMTFCLLATATTSGAIAAPPVLPPQVSEQAVQVAIKRLTSTRTSLIIAHRLSTIQHADRILMMNAGRIVESGTHTELLALDGAYAHLYRLGFQKT